MKLETLGGQKATIATLANGVKILYSYDTPVAAIVKGKKYRCSAHYSRTSDRHVNQFLGKGEGDLVEASFFNAEKLGLL